MKFDVKTLNIVRDSERKVIEFTIDRRFWYRGDSPEFSTLLGTSGKMCCLGFYARACGFIPKDLLGVELPSLIEMEHTLPKEMVWLNPLSRRPNKGRPFDEHSFENILADLNDAEEVINSEREQLIQDLFEENGIKVNFIN